MNERLNNGVRARIDGKGDPWALAHREDLGQGFNMMDLDGFFGQMAFASNTGERLFLEYVPDAWENRHERLREFAIVALFDRKKTYEYSQSEGNRVSLAVYLWLCRLIARFQGDPPKFFIVSGEAQPPWQMTELNINSGMPEPGCSWQLTPGNPHHWKQVWEAAGLKHLRAQLSQWLMKPKPPA